jgi:hypothetical protein
MLSEQMFFSAETIEEAYDVGYANSSGNGHIIISRYSFFVVFCVCA